MVVISTINNQDTLIHDNIANCSIAVLKREQLLMFVFTQSHTDFYISPGTDHFKFRGDGSHCLNQSLNYFPVRYTFNISLESKSHNLLFSLDQLHVGCLHS